MTTTLDEITAGVIEGNTPLVLAKVEQAIAEGVSADAILNLALIPGMARVGELYEQGVIFVPEMLIAARAMDKAMHWLKPLLIAEGVPPIARVAIGTVKGDLHDIGKKLVSIMLEGAGFEIIDLGVDTPPEKFVQAVRDGAQVVAISALLTTTMLNMRSVIEALEAENLRQNVRVIVGGAPLTQSFAAEIGADGYAPDAASVVRMLRGLLAA
jgi:5-methyltetrahydrofolate--homocysteine methyltransferase